MVTDGYKYLMGEIKMTYGDNDPWGTTMRWLFGLADVVYVEFGKLVKDYRPSPLLNTRDDLEGYEHDMILAGIDEGTVTEEDVWNVYDVMYRYVDILRAAGLNY